MTLHFLASYSTAQLLMLFGGIGFLLINAFTLIGGLAGDDQNLIAASCGGMLWGRCFTAANLLRQRSNSDGLMIALTLVGFLGVICDLLFWVRYIRSRRASKSLSKPAVASDKTWPPPPTSPRG